MVVQILITTKTLYSITSFQLVCFLSGNMWFSYKLFLLEKASTKTLDYNSRVLEFNGLSGRLVKELAQYDIYFGGIRKLYTQYF